MVTDSQKHTQRVRYSAAQTVRVFSASTVGCNGPYLESLIFNLASALCVCLLFHGVDYPEKKSHTSSRLCYIAAETVVFIPQLM